MSDWKGDDWQRDRIDDGVVSDTESLVHQVNSLRAERLALRARNAQLVEALKGVQFFESNGITKTCMACGAAHFFSDGPPVVIKHKPGCWGGAILAALATVSKEPK